MPQEDGESRQTAVCASPAVAKGVVCPQTHTQEHSHTAAARRPTRTKPAAARLRTAQLRAGISAAMSSTWHGRRHATRHSARTVPHTHTHTHSLSLSLSPCNWQVKRGGEPTYPSMMQPTPRQWLSPKVVTRKYVPNVLMVARQRRRVQPQRSHTQK